MTKRIALVEFIQSVSAKERLTQPHPDDWLKEQDMADDKSQVGGQDRTRINVNEDYEVEYWCKELDVTEMELLKAVEKVGDQADAVREFLGRP